MSTATDLIDAIVVALRQHREELKPGAGDEYMCSCGWTFPFGSGPPQAALAHEIHRSEAVLAALMAVT